MKKLNMYLLNDEAFRAAFEESDLNDTDPDFDKSTCWQKLQPKIAGTKVFPIQWYRAAAAVLLLTLFTGWALTFRKYDQVKTLNSELSYSVKELEQRVFLQERLITEYEIRKQANPKEEPEKMRAAGKKKYTADLVLYGHKKEKSRSGAVIASSDTLQHLVIPVPPAAVRQVIVTEELAELKKKDTAGMIPEIKKNNKVMLFSGSNQPKPSFPQKQPGRRIKIQFYHSQDPVVDNDENLFSFLK